MERRSATARTPLSRSEPTTTERQAGEPPRARPASSEAHLDLTGEDASLRSLHETYAGPLFVYAVRRLGDRGAAEEVVQDTLERAWRHADRYDPGRGTLDAWLFTIARHRIVDHVRGQRRRLAADGPDPESLADRVAVDDIEEALETWQVAEALTGLGRRHRDALVATFYRGQSVADAAIELDIPEGTVKSRVYYALRALRLRLEEMGVVR